MGTGIDIYQLKADKLRLLIEALQAKNYAIIGPRFSEKVIRYDQISSIEDLALRYQDSQEAGSYELKKGEGGRLFNYTLGPDSFKKFLHPEKVSLFKAEKTNDSFKISHSYEPLGKVAFFTIRACEIAAIDIQDKVLMGQAYSDDMYMQNRENNLFIALNCHNPGATCFCTSMNTGPRALKNYDLCLSEFLNGEQHYFIIEAATAKGKSIVAEISAAEKVDQPQVSEHEIASMASQCSQSMKRAIDSANLPAAFAQGVESEVWADVAERCLACTNCTMVCPTCFCTTLEDVNDLKGNSERIRRHDSCFNAEFSYIHGGSVRQSTQSRYRQWISHKLVTWQEQFGTLGCVGCGRCITWCPPGIDITEEAKKLQEIYKE